MYYTDWYSKEHVWGKHTLKYWTVFFEDIVIQTGFMTKIDALLFIRWLNGGDVSSECAEIIASVVEENH